MGAWAFGPKDNDTALDAISYLKDGMRAGQSIFECMKTNFNVSSPLTDEDGLVVIGVGDWLLDVIGYMPADYYQLLPHAIAITNDGWSDNSKRAEEMAEWLDICNSLLDEDLTILN